MPDDANTSDRLRHDIDSGRSGDKVNFMDPASAPLGTDDEAAGTPPTPEQIRMAREHEILNRSSDPSARDLDDRSPASRNYQSGTPCYGVASTCGAIGLLAAFVIWLFLG